MLSWDFHPKAKEAISSKIIAILNNIIVENNWPEFNSYKSTISVLYDELNKHKNKYLNWGDVAGILVDKIYNYLNTVTAENTKLNGKLSEIISCEEIDGISQNIISFLNSFPIHYKLYFYFPALDWIDKQELCLSEEITLIKVLENDFQAYQPSMLDLLISPPSKLIKNSFYIRLDIDGYVRPDIRNITIERALEKIIAIIEFGIIIGFFKKINTSTPIYPIAKLESSIKIFDDNTKENGKSLSLPNAVNLLFSSLVVNEKYLEQIKYLTEDSDCIKFLSKVFSDILNLMSKPESDEDANTLKTALFWSFESRIAGNETFAFIQTCIGLEAILGERAETEMLSSTLADRCAFIIGQTFEWRDEIRKEFKLIYKLRSKLIHGRKAKLPKDEEELFYLAQFYLEELIKREIKKLY